MGQIWGKYIKLSVKVVPETGVEPATNGLGNGYPWAQNLQKKSFFQKFSRVPLFFIILLLFFGYNKFTPSTILYSPSS